MLSYADRMCAMSQSCFFGEHTEAGAVAVKSDSLAKTFCSFALLRPLAPPGIAPLVLQKNLRVSSRVRAIVLAHDLPDAFGSCTRLVERDTADRVVQHMRLHDIMEHVTPDEAEVPIHGRRCAPHIVPCLWPVIGKRRVRML